jgi:hypothetical protein
MGKKGEVGTIWLDGKQGETISLDVIDGGVVTLDGKR